jgi:hypothetical protein
MDIVSSYINYFLTLLADGKVQSVEESFARGDDFQFIVDGQVLSDAVDSGLAKLEEMFRHTKITVDVVSGQLVSSAVVGFTSLTAVRDSARRRYHLLVVLEEYEDNGYMARHVSIFSVAPELPQEQLPLKGPVSPDVQLGDPIHVTAIDPPIAADNTARRTTDNTPTKNKKSKASEKASPKPSQESPRSAPSEEKTQESAQRATPEAKAGSWANLARDAQKGVAPALVRRVATPPPHDAEAPKAKNVVDKAFCRWPSLDLTEAQVRAALSSWNDSVVRLSLRSMKEQRSTLVFIEFSEFALESLQNHPPTIQGRPMAFEKLKDRKG